MVELSILEYRVKDINAVMNVVDSKKVILLSHSEGGSAAILFSVTYPDKVIFLIAFGTFSKRKYSSDYPWVPKDEERENLLEKLAQYKVNYYRSGFTRIS